jgi:hypothetical protein
MIKANVGKRIVKERGEVWKKYIKSATNEFKGIDGRIIPAQPEKLIAVVISTGKVDKVMGCETIALNEYVVDKHIFDKLIFKSPVEATIEVGGTNGDKVLSLEIVKE